MGCSRARAGMSGTSYTGPGFLPHTAGVIWNDIGVGGIDFLGWSNVSLEWRHSDGVLLLGEIDVCNSLDTWCKVEHQS